MSGKWQPSYLGLNVLNQDWSHLLSYEYIIWSRRIQLLSGDDQLKNLNVAQ